MRLGNSSKAPRLDSSRAEFILSWSYSRAHAFNDCTMWLLINTFFLFYVADPNFLPPGGHLPDQLCSLGPRGVHAGLCQIPHLSTNTDGVSAPSTSCTVSSWLTLFSISFGGEVNPRPLPCIRSLTVVTQRSRCCYDPHFLDEETHVFSPTLIKSLQLFF